MILDLFFKNQNEKISVKKLEYFTVSALFIAVKLKSVIIYDI